MNVKILGEESITKEDLPTYIYRNVKPSLKWNRQFKVDVIKQGIRKIEKIYHPMWIIKMLVIADRKPFPPKTKPNMAFVDAVSGYRGLFPSVPPIHSKELSNPMVKTSFIDNEEMLDKYITDIQDKQINRSYILKKPRYEIKETELVYLPLWYVEVDTNFLTKNFLMNGNTGQSEDLIRKLSISKEWIINWDEGKGPSSQNPLGQ